MKKAETRISAQSNIHKPEGRMHREYRSVKPETPVV